MLIGIWIGLSVVIAAVMGPDRKGGVGLALIVCLVTSPLIGFLLLSLMGKEQPKPVEKDLAAKLKEADQLLANGTITDAEHAEMRRSIISGAK